ncbi:arsenate reductase ArsC [Oricola cellulosilytica]|uniref:Arsenate reductase ArsC n=1 Tax=Oricola cellulosilytica TaxID=1429082 RepID=A0A4R0PDF2_9HYPH|nr:arsenate reductase ArsC [Oricola cellulosilytica]TCD14245.1 arsenate reductase ArsC [Oricola cellulosilytica]
MSDQPFNILILCTANSARSILGEAILTKLCGDRVKAFSAGSTPRGTPNPDGIALLKSLGHDVGGLRSKSWDEFAGPDAPKMDIVITVCDNAAGESCPFWPGAPVQAHWGIPDPAGRGETSDERRAAFAETYRLLEARILALASLPFEEMQPQDLKAALNTIGAMSGATDLAASGAG